MIVVNFVWGNVHPLPTDGDDADDVVEETATRVMISNVNFHDIIIEEGVWN